MLFRSSTTHTRSIGVWMKTIGFFGEDGGDVLSLFKGRMFLTQCFLIRRPVFYDATTLQQKQVGCLGGGVLASHGACLRRRHRPHTPKNPKNLFLPHRLSNRLVLGVNR